MLLNSFVELLNDIQISGSSMDLHLKFYAFFTVNSQLHRLGIGPHMDQPKVIPCGRTEYRLQNRKIE